MPRLTLSLIHRFRQWERPARIAMLLALALFAVVIVVAGLGPADLRQPAIFGIIGLALVMQLIALWANRDLVTPFTQAQRRYLAGDFETARAILEADRASADARALTLLGNTHRQLGRLEDSETVLREALTLEPDHHFPRYGLGMTLLAQGRYAEAAAMLQAAVDAGAPSVVRIDLGEALYRDQRMDDARAVLEAVDLRGERSYEPYRVLMARFLLWRLGAGGPPDAALIEQGIAFWQAAARRYAHTPYGSALRHDLEALAPR